jgi:HlyD family secretion protein
VLYGNVDLRQVELAFNNNERIAAVLVQEGDRVKRGQLLARLDTRRLEPQVAEAEATAAAQLQVVERLHNGSRPQEIAEARANVESARADAINARGQDERRKTLAANSIVSQQDLDNAKAALDVAEAKLTVNQKTLDLAIAGPRKEDIGRLSCAKSSRRPSSSPLWMPSSIRDLWSRGRWRRRKSQYSRWRSLIRNGYEPMSQSRMSAS